MMQQEAEKLQIWSQDATILAKMIQPNFGKVLEFMKSSPYS